jgi:hypothetical protein
MMAVRHTRVFRLKTNESNESKVARRASKLETTVAGLPDRERKDLQNALIKLGTHHVLVRRQQWATPLLLGQ